MSNINSDTIAITLASLVKNKFGVWVSEKQANYIRSQCYDKDYYITFTNSRLPSTLFYFLDDVGIIRVEKDWKNGKKTSEFDRENIIDPNIALRNRYLREIKTIENSIKVRVEQKPQYEITTLEETIVLKNDMLGTELKLKKLVENKQFFIDENLQDAYSVFHENYTNHIEQLNTLILTTINLYDTAMKYDLDKLSAYQELLTNLN